MPPLRDLREAPPLSFRINAGLRRSWLGRWLYRRRRRREADVYLLSFPKAGRTWLRVMVAKALMLHYELKDEQEYMDLSRLARRCPGLPRIKVKHDEDPHFKRPSELVTNKSEYRDCKVILLVRDIADMAISSYFQLTRREKCFTGTLPQYLACSRGSVDTMIRWYNVWAANRRVPRDLLVVRYEDLHADGRGQLRRVLDFVGIEGVADRVIKEAVSFARFENMRALERENGLGTDRLRPADPSDPESFKTRRGIVGGHRAYLSARESQALTKKIAASLDPLYRYAPSDMRAAG